MRLWPDLPVLFCLVLFPRVAGAATFTATLERDTITLGESSTLSLAFSDGQPQNPPSPAQIPNLQITYIGPSSQFSVINGQVSSSVTYNFSVVPRQAGDYTIPAMTVDIGGQKLTSQPLVLKVLKPTAPSPEALNSGAQLAFLKLVVPRTNLYVGETVPGQLQIYVQNRVGLSGLQLSGFPAEGFNVGKMIEGQRRQTQVGNSVYTVIPVSFTLKPVKIGALTLGPVTANTTIEVPSANRRRDLWDPFGMLGNSEQKQIALASEAQPAQSLPLPAENVPANFNGAVGSYNLTLTAGPTNVAAGDPITVKIQISGRGSLDSLALPDQPAWHDFKTYPPTTKIETTDALGLQGTKTFEQIVTPQNADIKALPPVSFSFFDPEQKAYRTLTQPAVPLVVRPGGAAPTPTFLTTRKDQDNAAPSQDIVAIKQRAGALAQIGPPLIEQRWFLAAQGIPVVAFVSVLMWRRRADLLANNPRLRRQRQVAQLIRTGLEQLKSLAAQNNSDEFFATVFRLLQEQIGERLDLPATSITEAVIDEHLRPRRTPEPLLEALQELFQSCNLARYAPIKSSQELAAVIPRLESVIRELEGLKL
jgi:hypothetical protein